MWIMIFSGMSWEWSARIYLRHRKVSFLMKEMKILMKKNKEQAFSNPVRANRLLLQKVKRRYWTISEGILPKWLRVELWTLLLDVNRKLKGFLRYYPAEKRITLSLLVNPALVKQLLLKVWHYVLFSVR